MDAQGGPHEWADLPPDVIGAIGATNAADPAELLQRIACVCKVDVDPR
jgi:hypothetical protein